MADKNASENRKLSVSDSFAKKLDALNLKKKAVVEGNLLGEHGYRLSQFAMQEDRIIGVRDLSTFAGSQMAEKIGIGAAGSSEDVYSLDAYGKDIAVKAKSSLFPEIGGLIPAKNILSKKPMADANEREKLDNYFEGLVKKDGSKHSLVVATKEIEGVKYDIEFKTDPSLVSEKNPNGVSFAYRDSEGNLFDLNSEGKLQHIEDPDNNYEPVQVFADKETGRPLIPDYDTAIHGSKKSSITKVDHPEYGFVRPEEVAIIDKLQKETHNMIRHGADTENPYGHEFEMSEDTPYTLFTPDGKVHSIETPKQYIDFVNKCREEGYDLVLNPRTGVEMVNGEYVLPDKDARLDYAEMDKKIASMPEEMQKEARAIYDLDIQRKQVSAALPEAVYEMEKEKASKKGETVTMDEVKKKLDSIDKNLKESIKEKNAEFKKKYGVDSPTIEAYSERKSKLSKVKARASAIERRASISMDAPSRRQSVVSPIKRRESLVSRMREKFENLSNSSSASASPVPRGKVQNQGKGQSGGRGI